MMSVHPYSAPSTAPLVSLVDALTRRGHEARLIAAACFVAVRTPQGPDPFKRIYLCDGRFRWAGTPASGQDIASHDEVSRAADMIVGVLGCDEDARDVAASVGTVSFRAYPGGGRATEQGTR